VIDRALAEAVLRDVIAACDPARRVRAALAEPAIAARLAGRRRVAFAAGKAALAMARGAGEVAAGIAVVPRGAGGALPGGWRLLEAAHPEPDASSVAAGHAVRQLVAAARADDVVLALMSGGASALIEVPIGALDALVATVRGVMAAGAPIDEINAVRGQLSAIKAGKLARASAAPIVTLAVSDVIGDPLAVIGSGPTIAAGRPADHAVVIAAMASAAQAAIPALAARGVAARMIAAPIAGDVEAVAIGLLATGGPLVAWGEPTLRVPAVHGAGGRAQQLALVLARGLRGSARTALVVGTDGIDGPPPPGRPAPAGAWIDGATWDAIAATRDPDAALATCDAGTALAAVGALVVIGPSGINHADLVLLG
jgi:glycerate 2-kinase